MISIIIPVYNEAEVVALTVKAVTDVFAHTPHELLLVNDGSRDGTWAAIEALAPDFPTVRGISFARNFGKEAAMFAGLDYARGECAVIMDGDLQHPPEAALEMYERWLQGDVDIIEGMKTQRQKESLMNRAAAGLFYSMLKKLSGVTLKNASDFKLLSRKAIDIVRAMPERQTFFRAITGWTGLPTATVYYETAPRAGGETKFNWTSLFRLALDSIVSYSSVPLMFSTIMGLIFCGFAAVLGVHTLVNFFIGNAVAGFTTVILLLLIIGGILLLTLGIIGIYIAKIYNEIKHRPRYIVGRTTDK